MNTTEQELASLREYTRELAAFTQKLADRVAKADGGPEWQIPKMRDKR